MLPVARNAEPLFPAIVPAPIVHVPPVTLVSLMPLTPPLELTVARAPPLVRAWPFRSSATLLAAVAVVTPVDVLMLWTLTFVQLEL